MIGTLPDWGHVGDVPDRLTDISSWHTHIPFAFWCIERLRPRVLVELGTHRGDSYCAFCQAVAREGTGTACYAVDTWRGDPQAGAYGEEVLEELRAYHDPRYGAFSRLVRSTFDEASVHFSDGSIDLLHVDGCHTYEAVRHDFETWAPRLSRRAVVLFHDVNVREEAFGAWRLWEELQGTRPSFTFLHGHGLGVLLWGDEAPEPARALASCSPEDTAAVRAFFARLGDAVAARRPRLPADAGAAALRARLEALEGALVREGGERQRAEGVAQEQGRRLEALQGELSGARAAVDTLAREVGAWREQRSRGLGARLRKLGAKLRHALAVGGLLVYWTATGRLAAGLRLRRYARLIRRARLFDPEHYLSQLPDRAAAARDPLGHYLRHGSARGLDPNPYFEVRWYREHHPDVAAAGKEPLVHYIRYGAREGRCTGPRFDSAFYAAQHPEVQGSGLTPLAHYLLSGAARGLACIPPGRALPSMEDAEARPLPGPEAATRVLVVDRRILTPQEDSGSLRMLRLLELLREWGLTVTFGADEERRSERDEQRLRGLGLELLVGARAIADHLRAEGGRYALAVLSRPEIAARHLAAVRAHAPWARVIYDTVDLHWIRMERASAVTGDAGLRAEAEEFRRLEPLLAEAADLAFTVTPGEQQLLQRAAPSARVEVIPNIHSPRSSRAPWGSRRGLLFVGGYEHAPNVDAVEWFAAEIFPRVRRELPEAVLQVVGSKAPERVLRLESPSVRVLGWVPELAPVFDASRVFVAPLRYGAGMLGKVGQSIEHGLPVVTTSIGADGLGLVDGETALVADGAEAFAAAVVRLYRDELLWSRVARNATQLLERYSPPAVGERLRASLERLVPGLVPGEGASRRAP